MLELDSLRSNVLNLSNQILDLIIKRKKQVSLIQTLKLSEKDRKALTFSQNRNFQNFDPEREKIVFNSLEVKSDLTLKEVFALSLLIESQAGESTTYPSWSTGVHIEGEVRDISHQINPILLASTFKNSYDALPLRGDFKEILENYNLDNNER